MCVILPLNVFTIFLNYLMNLVNNKGSKSVVYALEPYINAVLYPVFSVTVRPFSKFRPPPLIISCCLVNYSWLNEVVTFTIFYSSSLALK